MYAGICKAGYPPDTRKSKLKVHVENSNDHFMSATPNEVG